jgi:hypothetical protein
MPTPVAPAARADPIAVVNRATAVKLCEKGPTGPFSFVPNRRISPALWVGTGWRQAIATPCQALHQLTYRLKLIALTFEFRNNMTDGVYGGL